MNRQLLTLISQQLLLQNPTYRIPHARSIPFAVVAAVQTSCTGYDDIAIGAAAIGTLRNAYNRPGCCTHYVGRIG